MFGLTAKLRVVELEKKIIEQESLIKDYQKTIDKINADVPASSFSFDFNSVKVFSIERNYSENRPVTVIGYFLPEARVVENADGIITNDIVREWYLFCDQEQHEKLVEEFNKSKGIK